LPSVSQMMDGGKRSAVNAHCTDTERTLETINLACAATTTNNRVNTSAACTMHWYSLASHSECQNYSVKPYLAYLIKANEYSKFSIWIVFGIWIFGYLYIRLHAYILIFWSFLSILGILNKDVSIGFTSIKPQYQYYNLPLYTNYSISNVYK